MQTLQQFINRHGITADVEYTDTNPNMEDSRYPMNHWKVTLRRSNPRRQMTVLFSTGLGISGQPDADDVLNCIISDAAGIENAQGFEDWASEYGYDEDSRKAERIYKACQREARKLSQFLGDEYDDALWDTEQL